MAGASGLEIPVPLEEVGQVADPAFERQQFPGERKLLDFDGFQKVDGFAEVALGQGFKPVDADIDLRKVGLVLAGGRADRPDHVAEITEDGTRHGRVEIDHAHALLSPGVEQDVVEFGVVVGNPFRQTAGFDQLDQSDAVAFPDEGKFDLVHGAFESLGVGLVDRRTQGLESFARVVKVGDGLVEPFTIEIGGQLLEPSEGLGGFAGLGQGLDLLVAQSSLDEGIGSPVVSVGIASPGISVDGGNAGQGAPVGLGIVLVAQAVQCMAGDALDVLHQGDGLPENVVVDPLVDEPDWPSGDLIVGAVGVIDVTGSVGLGMHEIRPHVEERRDGPEVVHGRTVVESVQVVNEKAHRRVAGAAYEIDSPDVNGESSACLFEVSGIW